MMQQRLQFRHENPEEKRETFWSQINWQSHWSDVQNVVAIRILPASSRWQWKHFFPFPRCSSILFILILCRIRFDRMSLSVGWMGLCWASSGSREILNVHFLSLIASELRLLCSSESHSPVTEHDFVTLNYFRVNSEQWKLRISVCRRWIQGKKSWED